MRASECSSYKSPLLVPQFTIVNHVGKSTDGNSSMNLRLLAFHLRQTVFLSIANSFLIVICHSWGDHCEKGSGNRHQSPDLRMPSLAFAFTEITQELEEPILAVTEGALFLFDCVGYSGTIHVLSRVFIRIEKLIVRIIEIFSVRMICAYIVVRMRTANSAGLSGPIRRISICENRTKADTLHISRSLTSSA